jgi:hypothetical protein
MVQPASLALPLVALLLSCCLLSPTAEAPEPYLDAFGQHSVLADKLAELVGAEEPLLPSDLARLTTEVRCGGWRVPAAAAAANCTITNVHTSVARIGVPLSPCLIGQRLFLLRWFAVVISDLLFCLAARIACSF